MFNTFRTLNSAVTPLKRYWRPDKGSSNIEEAEPYPL